MLSGILPFRFKTALRQILTWSVLLLPFFTGAKPVSEDSLRTLLTTATTDSVRARVSGQLAWQLKFTNNDAAWQLAADEIKYAGADSLMLADAYRTQALVRVIENKIPEGLNLYQRSIENARKAHSYYYEASCLSLIAGMYQDMGDYDQALHYYFEGLNVAQQGNNAPMAGTLYNNIASVYTEAQRSPELALQFYRLALQKALALNNSAFAELITGNMASEYIRAGKKDSAGIMIRASMDYARQSNIRSYEYASSLANIGDINFQLHNFTEAENNLEESVAILDSLKRPINVLVPLSVLCRLYVQQNNMPRAALLGNRLLNTALQYHTKAYIRDGYKILSDVAHRQKNDAVALQYYVNYCAWNDSVFNDTKEKNIAGIQSRVQLAQQKLEIQYETRKKVQENDLLKLQNNNLRTGVVAAVVVALLLSILAFLIFRSQKAQQKSNRELEQRNRLIEQQAHEKDILMQEIHHRVKNNLQIVSSLLNLQAGAIDDAAAKDALRESRNRVNSIAFIHQKLYQQDDISAIALQEYIEQLCNHLKHVFNARLTEIQCTVTPANLKLDMETAIPLGVILNELITNSIKYAGINRPGGYITVNIGTNTYGQCTLHFSDNGTGMPDGFDIKNSSTLGLRMVHELTRQLQGTLSYTSAPEPTYTIVFPFKKQ